MFKHALLCAALSMPLYAHAASNQEAGPGQGQNGQATETAKLNSIEGLVRDSQGHPVSGASVTLKSATGEIVGHATSGADGRFSFSVAAPGAYAVVSDKSGYESGSSIVTLAAGASASTTITLAATQLQEVSIITTRLEKARNGLSPKTGGSVYSFDASDVNNLPQGENTSFNQVLLQAPDVANDSFGQLHVRGDHGNTQYRINGVILPEGISGFGQSLDTRFAQNIDLLTGALPAQYGYRTAGVIEINTKTNFKAGGHVDVYGGSNNTFNPSVEYGNTNGNLSYFVDGSYLTSNNGIESPTPDANPIHDRTDQYKGFAYLSDLLSPDTKLSFMLGSYDGKFQIPDNPGQPTYVSINGPLGSLPATYDSSTLNDQQREVNRFAITALQSSLSDSFDYQVALFTRYSSVHYVPDINGNLAFNAVASDLFRSSSSTGIQADGSDRLNDEHTLRMGMFASSENIVSDNTSTVIQTAAVPPYNIGDQRTIIDNNSKNGNTLFGAYLQDEWKATSKLTVNYGARFDQVNAYVDEHQLSPRLGLVYKASDQTTWHAGYARYFTPPPTELVSTTDQARFADTTGAAPGQNSPVKSERSNYFDAGVTHQLTQTTSLGLDTFYKESKNVIDEGQFGPAPILTPFNYEKGRIYGAELTASYKSGDFSGYANLARIVSKAKNIISSQYLFDPTELAYAANNWVNVDHEQALTISTGAAYLWSGNRLTGDLIYESGLRNGFANTTHLPGYTVLNLGASRKMNLAWIGPVEARLVLANALDKVYQIRDGSGIGVFAPQYGPRRGLFAGLTKQL
jgi:outer membrane receptor protein involved in Fe transport